VKQRKRKPSFRLIRITPLMREHRQAEKQCPLSIQCFSAFSGTAAVGCNT
jgi:hypothetical protein